MKKLNKQELLAISAGENHSCFEYHGYNYLTPEGEVRFLAFKYVDESGEFWFGVDHGWQKISDNVVVIKVCQ